MKQLQVGGWQQWGEAGREQQWDEAGGGQQWGKAGREQQWDEAGGGQRWGQTVGYIILSI